MLPIEFGKLYINHKFLKKIYIHCRPYVKDPFSEIAIYCSLQIVKCEG